jgi:hypothetical protein
LGDRVERRFIDYRRKENWLIAGPAALVGGVLLFGIMWVVGAVTHDLPKSAALALQFALISLYVTALAPYVFRMLRLAA